MRHRPRRARAAGPALAAVLALLALTGCTGGTAGEGQPAGTAGSPTPAAVESESAPSEEPPEESSRAAPDPRTLRGPATADQIPEIEPVASPTPELPVTTVGVDGVEVTVTDTSRLLALDLYGTLVETVIGLGLGERLVGRSVSNTEASVADLPVVTQNGHELSAEAILGLDPTAVVMDTTMGPPEIPDQLRSAGVPVLVVSPERGVDLIAEQIRHVAGALGVAEAGETLVDQFEGDLGEAETYVAELAGEWDPLRMAFLYVRGTGSVFFVMGDGSGGDDLIEHIGGLDAATDAGISDIVPATAEAVIALDPEVILTMTGGLESTGGLDGLLERPGIAQSVAGEQERVIDMADGDVLSFGPSFPAVLTALADAVYQP
ncbi:heme/hemin ABC transporter substrate-binding protein [Ruania halotolerans]|uniref:heme/hemin ABC transporter substrate-binding protein n=1 Tax=Ruania halotolerans TaxID=2897773 RepID=UPI001E460E02|nr:ABC transporter substrate-binding protein [Ruania halotolerans]UFU06840.1 ABC transporter substrate-binding protein [Ruania halotolerans]